MIGVAGTSLILITSSLSDPFSETLLRISSLQLSESAISTIVDFGVSSWSIISSTAPIPSFSPSLSISIASSTGSLAIFSSMFSSIAVSSNSLVLDSVGFRVGVMVEVAESYENVLVTFLAILSTIAESFFDLSSLVLSTISMTSEVVFFSTISSTTLLGAACLSTISSTIDSCISFESSLISSIMFSGSCEVSRRLMTSSFLFSSTRINSSASVAAPVSGIFSTALDSSNSCWCSKSSD